jgi:hypothetical protein
MHRLRIGLLCLMMVFVFGISIKVAGQENEASEPTLEDMNVPMGIIVLEPDESIENKRTPVEFYHSKHFTFECKECHHKWEGKAKIPTCTTTDCHDSLKSPKRPTKYLSYTDEAILYYKYAYHQMCVGCHKEIKIKRKAMEASYTLLKDKLPKTGPTGCIECHPKE